MKAVTFTEYGGPEVLHVAEAEEPHAGPGQIRIAVRAAGVNPIDWKARSGAIREVMPLSFPADRRPRGGGRRRRGRAGRERRRRRATRSSASPSAARPPSTPCSTTSRASPRACRGRRRPALPVAVETSLRVFNVLGGVGEGQTLVVNGAAGGVGVAAVQIARARGARVIGTASEANHEFLRSLGAEPTTYGDGMVERIRALAPDGVDLAFDTAGKGGIPDLISSPATRRGSRRSPTSAPPRSA